MEFGDIYCLTSPSGKKYIGQAVKNYYFAEPLLWEKVESLSSKKMVLKWLCSSWVLGSGSEKGQSVNCKLY